MTLALGAQHFVQTGPHAACPRVRAGAGQKEPPHAHTRAVRGRFAPSGARAGASGCAIAPAMTDASSRMSPLAKTAPLMPKRPRQPWPLWPDQAAPGLPPRVRQCNIAPRVVGGGPASPAGPGPRLLGGRACPGRPPAGLQTANTATGPSAELAPHPPARASAPVPPRRHPPPSRREIPPARSSASAHAAAERSAAAGWTESS